MSKIINRIRILAVHFFLIVLAPNCDLNTETGPSDTLSGSNLAVLFSLFAPNSPEAPWPPKCGKYHSGFKFRDTLTHKMIAAYDLPNYNSPANNMADYIDETFDFMALTAGCSYKKAIKVSSAATQELIFDYNQNSQVASGIELFNAGAERLEFLYDSNLNLKTRTNFLEQAIPK